MNKHANILIRNIDNAIENGQYDIAIQWLRVLEDYRELVLPLTEQNES